MYLYFQKVKFKEKYKKIKLFNNDSTARVNDHI